MTSAAGLLAFAWFSWLSLGRWNAGRSTSYDLGIFAQCADSYAHFRLPHSTIRGLDLLGDHFSPILALWAVPWWIWSDPRVLLLAQAALFALAVAGIVAFAVSRGVRPAWLLIPLLLLARGLVAPALFDVHEVAFAAPLTVLLCWAVASARKWPAFLAAIGLVLTKEDLGLTVAAAGIAWLLVARRSGREQLRAGTMPGPLRARAMPGLLLVGIGVAGLVIAVVVMDLVKGGGSSYLGYFGGSAKIALPLQHPMPQWHRLLPLVLFTVSAGVIGWRSPLALIALPTLAWRMTSSSFNFWSIDFHYDVVPTCVAVMALLDVWPSRRMPHRRAVALVAVAAVASVAFGVADLAKKAVAPQDSLTTAIQTTQLRDLMTRVPHGERVIASNDTGTYLVPDYEVYTLTVDRQERARWVVLVLGTKWRSFYPSCAREQLVAAGPRHWQLGNVVLIDRGANAANSPLPAPTCTDPAV